ncbi:hypothetical protein B0T09DRAFT_154976 [Sordaria sp. MPI-SDFR-AT-0083]|nr:hypothetical protein B0T09DRAFT_154976 [Sordaria sp. MPI-SDFR-AT-0083]
MSVPGGHHEALDWKAALQGSLSVVRFNMLVNSYSELRTPVFEVRHRGLKHDPNNQELRHRHYLEYYNHFVLDKALHSSAPYRPLCPGYDCQTDRNWQEDYVHKQNNVVDASRFQNKMFEACVDLIRLVTALSLTILRYPISIYVYGRKTGFLPPCPPPSSLSSFLPSFLYFLLAIVQNRKRS